MNIMKEINLKFSVEECNLLLEALGKMPYERAFSIVASLQRQAAEQLNGADEAPVDPPKGKGSKHE